MRGHNGTVRILKFAPAIPQNKVVGSQEGLSSPPIASAGGGDFKPRLWDATTGFLLCFATSILVTYGL